MKDEISPEFNRIYDGYWAHILRSDEIFNLAKEGMFNPELNDSPETPNGRRTPEDDIVRQLYGANKDALEEAIENGEKDEDKLLDIISNWKTVYNKGDYPKFTFLGLRTTTDCNLTRRCVYCDQKRYQNKIPFSKWDEVVKEVTEDGKRKAIYMGISGGEPLMDGELLYGKDGLIKKAAESGGVVNLNSNAHLITPQVAINLIGSGLAKLHVSLDAPDKNTHNNLEGQGSFQRVMEGLYCVQLAKAAIGTKYPVLHINTVATKNNLLMFDKLLEFLLQRRRVADDYSKGDTHTNPDLRDLAPHLIPLGGARNNDLMPTKEDWMKFIKDVWPNASNIWEKFQDQSNISSDKRTTLQEICFFANPFTRVDFNAPIEEIIDDFSQGQYSSHALVKKCYSAPTQAYILPNGDVFPCGSVSDNTDSQPLGNINEKSLKEIIHDNIDDLMSNFGNNCSSCKRCYGSTLAINQHIETGLREKIKNTLNSI